ncbi:YisL family protein [Sporosarcina sp. 6E9]|uniref:YisL family protein n=1 Tax=Sporosarcina sp. 6E9 TaxID=2819235 RepID=UPI001B307064|nr:YisL family protein [Sporosarcina sp. 6E9]
MIHFHIFTWVVGIILFLIAAVMANGSKGRKIVHMSSRLFYVLILVSGFMLFMNSSSLDPALYGVKFLLGLVTIGLMEMVLVRSSKEKNVTTLWIFFFIFLFATMFLGFKLPMGITWFA